MLEYIHTEQVMQDLSSYSKYKQDDWPWPQQARASEALRVKEGLLRIIVSARAAPAGGSRQGLRSPAWAASDLPLQPFQLLCALQELSFLWVPCFTSH